MSAVLKPVKRAPRTVRYTEVEHDIGDWDDEDLIAELERRKIDPPGGSARDVEEMFLAMKFGNKERALELLREYLMNLTGRLLP